MPIQLFQQIVHQSFHKEGKNLQKVSKLCDLIETACIIPTECFVQNRLAFNDGIPAIAFFNDPDQTATAITNRRSYQIKGAWLSSPYLVNTYFAEISDKNETLIIRFKPVAFYQSFAITASSLRRKPIWSLPDALGKKGIELLKIANTASTLQGKLQAINEYISAVDPKPLGNHLLSETLAIINSDRGQSSVKDILNSFKVNYKWLERNFNTYIGVSPKEYIKLQRFKHAFTALIRDESGQSTFSVAIDHGYYDTAHLLKDIKQYTGRPFMYRS